MVVVISGGSSGIGRQTASLFAERGHTVYELSRSGHSHDNISHIDCDVTDAKSVQTAIDYIGQKNASIDVVIANAGFGISGPFTETPDAAMIDQYNVNVFGAARLVKAAFPYLTRSRSTRGARVLFVSSVAADIALPFQAHYSATKAALKTFALALDNEWRPFAMRALALLPGDLKTQFTEKRVKNSGDQRADRSIEKMEKDELKGKTPEVVAAQIYSLVAKKKNPKVVSSLGVKYKAALFLFKFLPIRLSNYLIGRLYSA